MLGAGRDVWTGFSEGLLNQCCFPFPFFLNTFIICLDTKLALIIHFCLRTKCPDSGLPGGHLFGSRDLGVATVGTCAPPHGLVPSSGIPYCLFNASHYPVLWPVGFVGGAGKGNNNNLLSLEDCSLHPLLGHGSLGLCPLVVS